MVDDEDLKSFARNERVGSNPTSPTLLFVKNKLQPRQSNNGVTMQVTASKVRVDFTRLLSQLSAGPVEITKHGKVVAVLVHPDDLATGMEATTASPDEPMPPTDGMVSLRSFRPWSKAGEIIGPKPPTDAERTQDTSETPDASQAPTTACESVSLEAEEEGEEFSDDDESGTANSAWGWSEEEVETFERYLSSIEPDSSEFSEPTPF
jgi:antitoxin (DNA-binding transcriptional repressor) of toxin-antitoxin stability system